MKKLNKLFQLFLGLCIFPIIYMGICSLFNLIISKLFIVGFLNIQYSPIWVIWFILGMILEIFYFDQVANV
jgi:hypothetical protein